MSDKLSSAQQVLDETVPDEFGIEGLPRLPEAERRLVLETWNATLRPYPIGACAHDLFRAQAARTPNAVALSRRGERVTYAELEARANRISHALRRRGVGPEVRVGICLPRTPDLVAAMLGVLGAGGAYVPLDPAYPRERLGYMLEDAEISLVITDSTLADRLPESAAALLLLDRERDAIAAEPADAPESGVVPENLSHVIFTSGSTGRPKGVMIRHSSVVVLLHWLRENVTDEERASVLFSTSINFDVSVAEVFGTLAWGGKLVIAENALELATLDEDVVHVSMVPSAAAELLRSGGIPACVKTLNLGGEALPNALAKGLYALDTVEKVGNLYGPTEDTTYSTYHVVPRGASEMLVGRPVANTRAYVLDDRLQPVAVGAAGELYLAGAGLSRGYAHHPALTAERFIPCPFGPPGARMYRVMDRVRRRADGEIEYLGRIDFQVKIRGYRIELGEIEARLAGHPGVRQAIVLAREDEPGEKRLVAYVVGDAAADELRAHLAERIPEYMVPAAYVRLDALPLTPNGKVDRRALPAPEGDAYGARGYQAPADGTEQALAAIWAEVLGAGRVGRDDHFFDLGGHSLLAVRVVSRVRRELGVEVSSGDLFARPVLADFARGLATAARAQAPAIAPVDRSAPIPLSFAQQRLWILEQLGDPGGTYHIPLRLRLRGPLDRGALVRALDRIVARHEALRTTFAAVDGEPFQRIARAEDRAFRLVEHDLDALPHATDELRRLTSIEANAPFDLEHGPLARGRLIHLAADDHVLLLTLHHIVFDGWSAGVLYRELGALYGAFARGEADPLPPLPVQYPDYAAWHRRWVSGPVLRAQAEYWTRALDGAPELLELPADRPRPARQDFAGGSVQVELDPALGAALEALGQRHGATLFMALLAGWATVLARLSGQDDLVIGSPTANRGRGEIEGLIGFFVNTLALRVDLSGAPTVAELLRRVRDVALEAQRNQDIPIEQVVERVRPARTPAYTPLFQVMFAWQKTPAESPELPGLRSEAVPGSVHQGAAFDLSLSLQETAGRIRGELNYASALFERATAERFAGYLRRVLEEMAADDGRPVERLALMPAGERARVVEEWNRTGAPWPDAACVHQLFEAQVRRDPAATALLFGGRRVSYGQVNERANRLAHHLRALGAGPDVRVAICVERGVEMVVGLLAVLKAGAAYVPLDPDYPAERLAYMLADSAPAAVLTQRALRDRLGHAGVPVLELDAAAPPWANRPATDPAVEGLGPGHLAYVIYTSGSTGRPKGVMVAHGGLCNLLAHRRAELGYGPGDVVAALASYAFDIWLFEALLPLVSGAAVKLLPGVGRLGPRELLRELGEVTAFHAVPALMGQLLGEAEDAAEALRGVRHAFVGGEAVPPELLERMVALLPRAQVRVLYGPTEATVLAAQLRVPAAEGERGRAPSGTMLGRPLQNTRLYVLDGRGEPVPVGVAGELCIGGAGVARGYLGRPGLTAERFVADPFSGRAGARLYRTGDRARWRPDGTVEYLGRTDHQVKVRGFRIEPGEIEARLAEHPGVREAVVVAREHAPGETRLVAYVVGGADAEALRAHLAQRLPEYMVPAAYVRLDALPLTPNGKLDRAALPAPGGGAFAARAYQAPAGPVEQAVAAVWAELLGAGRVGRHDHFFDLGGHSLLAVRVASRVRQELGVQATPGDLFQRPVLADFAGGLAAAAPEESSGGIGSCSVDTLSEDDVDLLLAELLSKRTGG